MWFYYHYRHTCSYASTSSRWPTTHWALMWFYYHYRHTCSYASTSSRWPTTHWALMWFYYHYRHTCSYASTSSRWPTTHWGAGSVTDGNTFSVWVTDLGMDVEVNTLLLKEYKRRHTYFIISEKVQMQTRIFFKRVQVQIHFIDFDFWLWSETCNTCLRNLTSLLTPNPMIHNSLHPTDIQLSIGKEGKHHSVRIVLPDKLA